MDLSTFSFCLNIGLEEVAIMMWGNMGDWGPMGWVWGIMGFLFMATFWVGVILLIFYGIRALSRSGGAGGGPGKETSALDIARARYARGEIGKEEFEQLKRDLS